MYSKSSFFNLDSLFNNLKPLNYVKSIKIIDAFIPISKENFINNDYNNNFFYVKSNIYGLPGTFIPSCNNIKNFVKITIPSNNYDQVNIIDTINSILIDLKISELNGGLSFKLNNNKIEILNNLKYIEYTINFSNIDLIDNKNYLTLGYILGFRENEYNILPLKNIIAETFINFQIINYLFIKINDYGDIYATMKKSLKVLAKLNLDNKLNGYIINNSNLQSFTFNDPIFIKKLDIEIIDYSGNNYNTFEDFNFVLELSLASINNNQNNIPDINIERPIINDINNSFVLDEEKISKYKNIEPVLNIDYKKEKKISLDKVKEKEKKKSKINFSFNY